MSIPLFRTLFVLGCCCMVCSFADSPGRSPCKHTFQSGKTYDFTGAAQAVGEVTCFSSAGFRFTYVPCGVVSEATCNSPYPDQSACLKQTPKNLEGVSMVLGQRTVLASNTKRSMGKSTDSKFQCAPSTIGSLTCGTPAEAPSKNFNLIFTSKYACSVTSGGGKSSHGLSGGWIFIITLGGVALVYFVGGVLLQKFYKKERGLALLPNVGFWKMLPGLVVDGIYFSLNKVICCCRGQKNYEPL